jgi:hypothetical protein
MKFITDHLSKKHAKLVKQKANELFPPGIGLNGRATSVYKRQAKVKSKMGYPDEMSVITNCDVIITGFVDNSGEVFVWPAFVNNDQWFKTSPVVNVTVNDGKVIIETQNSVYEVVL